MIFSRVRGKKAQQVPQKVFHYTIFPLVLVVVFTFFVGTTNLYAETEADIPDSVEPTILISRFINSPDCFVYIDKASQRAYPGILDWEKLTNKNLHDCYDVEEDSESSAYKITVVLTGINLNKKAEFKTLNWEDNFPHNFKLERDVKVMIENKVLEAKLSLYKQGGEK